MDYKDTLILPATTFPMRAALPENEPARYKKWQEQKAYAKMQKKRANAQESFNIHDGPPYANGHLHIGHALNKILKDMIVKYHYFHGKKSTYVPGWDCHGLPIEQQVEKKLGKEKKDSLPKEKTRELCRNHASEFLEIQKSEFLELGIIGDFENPYKTMDFRFEANIYRALCDIARKGLLAERSKPVYWSWACRTALAEAEVEYQDKVSDSIYVAFPLQESAINKLGIKNASLVIWTTTPWTLPANVAIALKPDTLYALSSDGKIVAKELFKKCKSLGIVNGEITNEFSSSELLGLLARNPLNGHDSKVVLGEHVEIGDGTGCVHTAPGHGEDDYYVGLEYGLSVIMPVDDDGRFDESVVRDSLLPEADSFVGEHIFKAQSRILELLGENLLYHSKITHSYPHCWRSHEPVIFRATKQWFILMDEEIKGLGKTLREVALEEIEKTDFYPAHGIKRIGSMVANRPDWCISRQRDWGVPIAFFRDKANGEIILDGEVLEHIATIFEREGCDAWWSKDNSYLLPASWQEHAENLEKNQHILDVWFDSGSTWKAVLLSDFYHAGDYPASMYLEGSDQHRGWFQSSLLISCAINHYAPFKSILTHGFTVDEKGEKMSKSKGNVVAPNDVLRELGSEILRLWVASSDYQSDLKISKNILKQVSENYRKIRNTLRFLLANTNDLENLSPISEFSAIDRWIVDEARIAISEADALFGRYDFSKGIQELNYFITNALSGVYLDLCKDSLYCDAKDSHTRRASQSAMVYITRALLSTLAPVLTYTVDEALEHASEVVKNGAQDVFDLHYEELPSLDSQDIDFGKLLEFRAKFFEVIDSLKKDKKLKNTLEVNLLLPSLKFEFGELAKFMMVSEILSKKDGEEMASFEFEGEQYTLLVATKYKCPRCWQYISESEESPCHRCAEVLA
ncbi:MAG: isoleucine--tRNA ligase [Wolinella sp.]